MKGSGRLRVTGSPSRAVRDAIDTAHTYLKSQASRLGLGKNPDDLELHSFNLSTVLRACRAQDGVPSSSGLLGNATTSSLAS
jgi:hypothetical protein